MAERTLNKVFRLWLVSLSEQGNYDLKSLNELIDISMGIRSYWYYYFVEHEQPTL